VERFNLRKLSELEVRIQLSDRDFKQVRALENLSASDNINRASKNIQENIKTSAKDSLGLHELKQHMPWFDEDVYVFYIKGSRLKKQWVQDPSQSNE
jgi:hypothetical protein